MHSPSSVKKSDTSAGITMSKKSREKYYYKIGEAAAVTGLQPHVLRYWETVFPQLMPEKSSTGQRLYTRKTIDTVLLIKHLLYDKKYTIEGAVKALKVNKKQMSTWSEARVGTDTSVTAAVTSEAEAEAKAKDEDEDEAKAEATGSLPAAFSNPEQLSDEESSNKAMIDTLEQTMNHLEMQLDHQTARNKQLEAELTQATMLLAKAKSLLLSITR